MLPNIPRLDRLVVLAHNGDPDALDAVTRMAIKYAWTYLRKRRNQWYHPWGDLTDVTQDAVARALWYLPRTDPGEQPFALWCTMVRRGLSTSLKTANRQKHRILSRAMERSLDAARFHYEPESRTAKQRTGEDLVASDRPGTQDPLDVLVQTEQSSSVSPALRQLLESLTEVERTTLALRLRAMETRGRGRLGDMARAHGLTAKSVDNARLRILRKAKALGLGA